jgi:hypothetical protein
LAYQTGASDVVDQYSLHSPHVHGIANYYDRLILRLFIHLCLYQVLAGDAMPNLHPILYQNFIIYNALSGCNLLFRYWPLPVDPTLKLKSVTPSTIIPKRRFRSVLSAALLLLLERIWMQWLALSCQSYLPSCPPKYLHGLDHLIVQRRKITT